MVHGSICESQVVPVSTDIRCGVKSCMMAAFVWLQHKAHFAFSNNLHPNCTVRWSHRLHRKTMERTFKECRKWNWSDNRMRLDEGGGSGESPSSSFDTVDEDETPRATCSWPSGHEFKNRRQFIHVSVFFRAQKLPLLSFTLMNIFISPVYLRLRPTENQPCLPDEKKTYASKTCVWEVVFVLLSLAHWWKETRVGQKCSLLICLLTGKWEGTQSYLYFPKWSAAFVDVRHTDVSWQMEKENELNQKKPFWHFP